MQEMGLPGMERRRLLSSGVAAGMATAAATTSRAYADNSQINNDQDIVGSWFGTVSATNPPLGSFNDLISFHVGGVVTESRRYLIPGTPLGDLLETTGHGAWKRTGKFGYEAFFRFFIQDASSGAAIGTDNINLSLILDRKTGALAGTFQSQVKNTSDAVLLTVIGDYSATPITL
jgi:hypothetical protein